MSKRTWLGRAGIANLILGWMVMVACADEPKATGAEKVDEGQIGYSIFIMNSDGTALHAVCPMPEFTGQGTPSWSCDGKQIAFDAWKPASDEAAQVFVFTPEGKLLRELGPGSMPGFSPVSEELLISKYTPEWGTFWIPADGGKAEKLVAAIGPIWSPNGERLAFITPPGKGVGIYELGQEDLKPISAQLHHGGSWSPDGT